MIRLLVLVTLLASFLPAASDAFSPCDARDIAGYVPVKERENLGLFYQLLRCHGASDHYLLGTVHADDPAIRKVVSPAISALKTSAQLHVEFVEPANASALAERFMFLPKGDSLANHIGQDAFATLSQALLKHSNLSPKNASRFKPWAATALLHYPPAIADGVVLDLHLQQVAQTQGVPLNGLESFAEQLMLFNTLSNETEQALVEETLQQLPTLPELNQQLIRHYLADDLTALLALSNQSMQHTQSAALQQFMNDTLLVKRNRTMFQRALPKLNQKQQFIAVGALHLPGKTGLLEVLEKNGFYVINVPLAGFEG